LGLRTGTGKPTLLSRLDLQDSAYSFALDAGTVSDEFQVFERVSIGSLVKDLMIVEAGRNWILRAKTGWEGRTVFAPRSKGVARRTL